MIIGTCPPAANQLIASLRAQEILCHQGARLVRGDSKIELQSGPAGAAMAWGGAGDRAASTAPSGGSLLAESTFEPLVRGAS